MRTENVDGEHHALAMVESEWARNNSRRHDGSRGRSKLQSHLQWDMSNMQCSKTRCKQMKGDFKKLRNMNKDDANAQTNVVKSVEDENDVFLPTNYEVAKIKLVMDCIASKHIY